jgi:hypothetical protein
MSLCEMRFINMQIPSKQLQIMQGKHTPMEGIFDL